MMRLELHETLCRILGSRSVYYQPPESIKMQYPAIVYETSDIKNNFADNRVYRQSHIYKLTVIDKDPDSEVAEKISLLPTCRFNRGFATDNLNHYVFLIHNIKEETK